jgi:murein DD-endopeptidase MepM/ murein hydrolase activator NlpD
MRCKSGLWMLVFAGLLAACQVAAPTATATAPAPAATLTPPDATATETAPAPILEPTAQPSPTPPTAPQIASPLAGYDLEALPAQISNVYHPPAPGSDDPHQGVDFADFDAGDRIARTGMPVQAAIGGQVAAVIQDRFPYGNAVMVESPLDEFSSQWAESLNLPEPLLELRSGGALTCPETPALPQTERRSLYILYAHLLEAPEMQPGETIASGQALGKVGESGNALSPHLHFEVRVGPSGMVWSSMAHYDVSASIAEMGAYCLWRVSGAFQTIDPLCLLGLCQP